MQWKNIMAVVKSLRCYVLLAALFPLWGAAPALADSPLADAIESGRRATALELVEEGADVNAAQGDGTTPLQWATYKLDLVLVRTLLARGANVNTQNSFGA